MTLVNAQEGTAPFQIMPPLTPDEYAALEQSITEHGVLVPITVDVDGVIIDGHHRQEIALRLGLKCMRRTVRDLTDEQKVSMALTLNVHRRHLTREQRRELLALSLKAEPEASDREHGRRTGTDNKTAAKVRTDLEGREEIPHVDKRIDTKGREQPATKPKNTDKSHDSALDALQKIAGPLTTDDEYTEAELAEMKAMETVEYLECAVECMVNDLEEATLAYEKLSKDDDRAKATAVFRKAYGILNRVIDTLGERVVE
jgi:ParB-like chromosome segregation protein Spo0J